MNNKTAYRIIRDFIDGIIPIRYRNVVARWIVSDRNMEEKDTAMKTIWEQTEGDNSTVNKSLITFRCNRDDYEDSLRYKRKIRMILHYAAILALPLLTGALVWHYTSSHYYIASEMVELYVPEGKTDSLILSDGTIVTANGGSTFLYPREFNRKNGCRNVYLQGEAHFNVAKDTDKPFIVNIGKLKVQVRGTQFNVKAYPNNRHIITTLEEGQVSVYDSKSTTTLVPNEQANYDKVSGLLTKNHVDAARFNGWIAGNLFFDQQKLEEILTDLEHKYNVKFRIDPSVDLEHRYTMNFKYTETIDDVLKVISKLSKGLRYYKQGQIIKLYQERKELSH